MLYPQGVLRSHLSASYEQTKNEKRKNTQSGARIWYTRASNTIRDAISCLSKLVFCLLDTIDHLYR